MNPALIDASAAVVRAPDADSGRQAARRPLSIAAGKARTSRPSCWQWPHLMSLDAPLVALVWQRWWAHTANVTLPLSREWILGLGVWLIYLADRLADAADERSDGTGAARHVFSSRWRVFLLPLASGVALALTILALGWLPQAEFRSGLCLLALATGYFWLIHCWPDRGWATFLPKEAVVGGMFGAGTIFFVVCRSPRLPTVFWLGSVLFAVVCFFNCALITKWERQPRDLRERSSLLNAFPRLSSRLRSACVVLAMLTLAISTATASGGLLPVAVSALLLAGLDCSQSKLSADSLRVLADIVLLTPVFWLIWISANR